MSQDPQTVRESYDRIAAQYVDNIAGELAGKPFDRHLLNWFAERTAGLGPVWDVGCGPGHIARYLHGRGVPVAGLDLSPAMIAHAERLNPTISFRVGDMRSLDAADESVGGIVAFYSLIHFARDAVPDVLREFRRVLRPGGAVLAGFHKGNETVHRDELWDTPIALDFVWFESDEMAGYFAQAGLEVELLVEREPYTTGEHPSRRGYIGARR